MPLNNPYGKISAKPVKLMSDWLIEYVVRRGLPGPKMHREPA